MSANVPKPVEGLETTKPEITRQESSLMVPETKVQYPTFPVVIREWFRIRKWVGMLADPVPFLQNAGWACVGGVLSGVLALIVWIPTYQQLAQPLQDRFAWETPAIFIFTGASILGAGYSFWVSRKVGDVLHRDARMVGEDMDEITKHHHLKDQV
jgi:hypothetical protein